MGNGLWISCLEARAFLEILREKRPELLRRVYPPWLKGRIYVTANHSGSWWIMVYAAPGDVVMLCHFHMSGVWRYAEACQNICFVSCLQAALSSLVGLSRKSSQRKCPSRLLWVKRRPKTGVLCYGRGEIVLSIGPFQAPLTRICNEWWFPTKQVVSGSMLGFVHWSALLW